MIFFLIVILGFTLWTICLVNQFKPEKIRKNNFKWKLKLKLIKIFMKYDGWLKFYKNLMSFNSGEVLGLTNNIKHKICKFSLFLKVLFFLSKGSLNIREYRRLFIGRVLQIWKISHFLVFNRSPSSYLCSRSYSYS